MGGEESSSGDKKGGAQEGLNFTDLRTPGDDSPSGTSSSGTDCSSLRPPGQGNPLELDGYESSESEIPTPMSIPLPRDDCDYVYFSSVEARPLAAALLQLPRGSGRTAGKSCFMDSAEGLPGLLNNDEERNGTGSGDGSDPHGSEMDVTDAVSDALAQCTGDEYYDAIAALPELIHKFTKVALEHRAAVLDGTCPPSRQNQAAEYVRFLHCEIDTVVKWTVARPEFALVLAPGADIYDFLALWMRVARQLRAPVPPDAHRDKWERRTERDRLLAQRLVGVCRDVVLAWHQRDCLPLPPAPGAPALFRATGQAPWRCWDPALPPLAAAVVLAAVAAAIPLAASAADGAAGGMIGPAIILALAAACFGLLSSVPSMGRPALTTAVCLLLGLCTISPIACHWSLPEAAVPWGLLMLPSWAAAASLAAAHRGPLVLWAFTAAYAAAFAGRAALVAAGVGDAGVADAGWAADAAACFVVVATTALTDLSRVCGLVTSRRHDAERIRSRWYRHKANIALQDIHRAACSGQGGDMGPGARQHTQQALRLVSRLDTASENAEVCNALRQELTSLMQLGGGGGGGIPAGRHNSIMQQGRMAASSIGSVRLCGQARPTGKRPGPRASVSCKPKECVEDATEKAAPTAAAKSPVKKSVDFAPPQAVGDRCSDAPSRSGQQEEGRNCIGMSHPSPFGELVFPDPDGRAMEHAIDVIRVCARDIHQHVAVVIVSEDEGEVIYWNSQATFLTGMPAATVTGYDIASLLVEEQDQVRLTRLLDSAAEAANIDPWNGEDAPCPGQIAAPQTFAFLRSDGVSRVLLDVCAAGSYIPGYIVLTGVESRGRQSPIDYAQWILGQLWPSLGNVFDAVATLDEAQHGAMISRVKTCKILSTNLMNLVSIAREAAGQGFGPLHIPNVLNKMCCDFQSLARDNRVVLRLVPIPQDIPHEIRTHPYKLPRAIAYLVSNAIKYNVPDGAVELSVSVDTPVALPSATQSPIGAIRFTIRDTGRGIPPKALETIFDPKRPPKPDGSASRLGLPNTHLVVQEIGGYMTAESRTEDPERGSVFSIVLPLLRAGGDEGDAQVQTGEEAIDEHNGERVPVRCCLVETNQVYRMSFCHHLWARSYSLTIATSLARVLDCFAEQDLIIINVETAPFEIEDILEKLKLSSTQQVMLVSKLFTEFQRSCIQEAGWFGLALPLRKEALSKALNQVEDRVKEQLEQRAQIEDIRKAFAGNASCPWERGRTLGQGSFGKVFEATNKITGGKMACKTILLKGSDQEEQLVIILKEVSVMAQLEHPNIIHYFYCERSQDELRIFMELAEESLSKKVGQDGMSAEDASNYLHDILLGLQYLHSKNIVHRDIKVENVLINRGVCKLTDFGTAAHLPKQQDEKGKEDKSAAVSKEEKRLQDTAGTPQYMAPEVILEEGHDWRADIWSMGCLVMEMLTGRKPFSHIGTNSWAVIKYVSSLDKHSNINIGADKYKYHPYALSFIWDCIQFEPSKRKSTHALLESELVTLLNDSVARKQSVFGIANETRKQSIAHHASKRARMQRVARKVVETNMDCSDSDAPDSRHCSPMKSHSKTKKRVMLGDAVQFSDDDVGRKMSYATGIAPCPSALKKSSTPSPCGVPPSDEDDTSDNERRGTAFSGWGLAQGAKKAQGHDGGGDQMSTRSSVSSWGAPGTP